MKSSSVASPPQTCMYFSPLPMSNTKVMLVLMGIEKKTLTTSVNLPTVSCYKGHKNRRFTREQVRQGRESEFYLQIICSKCQGIPIATQWTLNRGLKGLILAADGRTMREWCGNKVLRMHSVFLMMFLLVSQCSTWCYGDCLYWLSTSHLTVQPF